MKINKPHYYLTEERARKLKVGDAIKVGWDDFNEGKEEALVYGEVRDGGPQPFYLELERPATKNRKAFRWVVYSFAGPHRDGTTNPIMCKGSGAERLYITK